LETGGNQPPVPAAMSLDDARALLVREHNTAIGADDPMLMAVTLHQGFIRDYEAMLKRHDAGIKAILGATGEACAATVEQVLDRLKEKTVKASLDQAFALVAEQAKNMDRLDRALRRHRLVNGLLTLLSFGVCALAVAILYTLLQ
jgi:hypothetical protein